MKTRHKYALYFITALVIAALAWPLLRPTPASAAATLGALPLTPAAAMTALGYPSAPNDASRYLCLTGKVFVLLGDSQTYRLFTHLNKLLGSCENEKMGGRCEDMNYLKMSREEMREWWQSARPVGSSDGSEEGPGAVPGTPLPADDEGPVAYGLHNLGHGCRDCQGVSELKPCSAAQVLTPSPRSPLLYFQCDARLSVCRDKTGIFSTAQMEVEYLAVEFTRDVSLRSPDHATTQEAIAAYLADRKVDYVVFNTGLHDTALKDSSPASYARNLRAYVALLRRRLPGARLLWIATSAVRPDMQPDIYRNVTTNDKIHAYNAVAAAVMAAAGIPVVDPFPLSQLPSFQALNDDGVHYPGRDGVYYELMAWSVLQMLCGAGASG
jgi:hypothetical protein